jgi:hypothetical protein
MVAADVLCTDLSSPAELRVPVKLRRAAHALACAAGRVLACHAGCVLTCPAGLRWPVLQGVS